MKHALEFVIRHGYVVLFAWVGAEQVGLPIPAVPLLMAAGALAGGGKMSPLLAIGVAVVASLVSDGIWYEIGRRKGIAVVNFLCKISLEPDSCVRKTENVFTKHGMRSLLVAKFVPGLNTMAPPLAGIFKMPFGRFLLWDGLGATLWSATFVALGYAFSDQLEQVAAMALPLGARLVALLLGALGLYIGWKFYQRHRFIRDLRVLRVTPDELKQMLDTQQPVFIVDLRGEIELEAEPETVPGALWMSAEQLDERHHEIPRDRDVILYCS